jgi:hypothetical protein
MKTGLEENHIRSYKPVSSGNCKIRSQLKRLSSAVWRSSGIPYFCLVAVMCVCHTCCRPVSSISSVGEGVSGWSGLFQGT